MRSPQSTGNPTAYAVEVLEKIRAGGAKGRAKVNPERKAKGEDNRIQIWNLMLEDQKAGHPSRGQAIRIRRMMGGALSESRIRKIISRARNSVRVSQAHTSSQTLTGGTPDAI